MDKIARYEIRGVLGSGGMGTVYRAWDPQLERDVAIKVVKVGTGADAAQFRERLVREARTAAGLTHGGIVAVYDVIEHEGEPCIVMEFVEGESLEARFDAAGKVGLDSILQNLREIAESLDFAHQHKVVHRDIKPANILIDKRGRAKVADFGIAKRVDATSVSQTATGATMGTFLYMAPEQLRGEPLDGRADQFSFAVLVYRALTGRLPFEGDTWVSVSFAILQQEPPDPRQAGLPDHVASALLQALAKNREQRFATCTEFVRALAGETKAAAGTRRFALAAMLTALAVALIGGFWLTRRGPAPAPPASEKKTETAASTPPNPPPVAEPAKPAASAAEPSAQGLEFAPIAAGQFMMGSDLGASQDEEKPRHLVRITKPFYMSTTEVTKESWAAVMGGAEPPAAEARLPRVEVSFVEASKYVAKLSSRGDGFVYRIPTEAEWEYAARAGRRDDMSKDLDAIAVYSGNTGGVSPAPVGKLEPNKWGLFDVLGNTWEWTSDWFAPGYYGQSPKEDPKGPPSGECRIIRGGGFKTQPMTMSVTYRHCAKPDEGNDELGFRIAASRVP